MVYRMADAKREKKITAKAFGETLKKLALRLDEAIIVRLCTFLNVNKDGTIKYDDYMATINAYQIQTEKYPLTGKSYTQSSLSKFAEAVGDQSIEDVFAEAANKNKTLTFEQFLSYARKNLPRMNEN